VKAWNLVSTPYTDARYVRIMYYYADLIFTRSSDKWLLKTE